MPKQVLCTKHVPTYKVGRSRQTRRARACAPGPGRARLLVQLVRSILSIEQEAINYQQNDAAARPSSSARGTGKVPRRWRRHGLGARLVVGGN
jgi:hypothetical protein